MSEDAVILASHIPSIDKLWVGKEVLDTIKTHLPNADIFAGINPCGAITEWKSMLTEYGARFIETPPDKAVPSDASAYQFGLKLFRDNLNDKYKNVWFFHTQGTKSNRHDVRRAHYNFLLNERDTYWKYYQNDIVGSSHFTSSVYNYVVPKVHSVNGNHIQKYMKFDFTPVEWFPMGTMYVIKYPIVKHFLENCSESFFEKFPFGDYSMYMFEVDFHRIVSLQGFVSISAKRFNTYSQPLYVPHSDCPMTGPGVYKFYEKELNEWLNINGLKYHGQRDIYMYNREGII